MISKSYKIVHVHSLYNNKHFSGEYLDFATFPQIKICTFVSFIFWNVYIIYILYL